MKWVTTWSNAISIVDAKPEGYAKDITLRYPILSSFNGNKVQITLDNFTGKESVHIEKVTIAKTINEQDIDNSTLKIITFNHTQAVDIAPGKNIVSDEIDYICSKNEQFSISIYLSEFTSMRAGVTTLGPLTKAYYSLHDQSETEILPREISKDMSWFYFLSNVDIYTEEKNQAILCYGDSITAQAWPEYLQLKLLDYNISSPRKAVSGSRILKEYSCVMYEPYGLKSSTRFPHETNISGCDKVIILQGVNDIIHPVGTEINPFRPMTDLPTVEELIEGYRNLIRISREKGMKVYLGTILPVKGWRTYASFREDIRQAINEWIKSTNEIDGYIDFAKYMCKEDDALTLYEEYDSGDHLHPSLKGYEKMSEIVLEALKKYEVL